MKIKRSDLPALISDETQVWPDFIVLACNSYDGMIELLREIKARGVFDPEKDSTGRAIEKALAVAK